MKLRPLLVLAFLLPLFAGAQNADRPLLSWERLSFSVGSAYYFSPWKNYNGALQKVTREISLDPFFEEPYGSYDKINGDLLAKAGLGYELVDNLSIVLTGQYGVLDANFETYPNPNEPPPEWKSSSYRQDIDFKIYSFGLDVLYELPLSNRILLLASTGLDQYYAQMDYRSAYDLWVAGPIIEGFPQVRVKMEDNSLGFNFMLGGEIKIAPPVAIRLAIKYRSVSFNDLEGNGWKNGGNTIEAELVESADYFGPLVEYTDYYETFGFPGTGSDKNELKKAKIELKSIGIELGLTVGL